MYHIDLLSENDLHHYATFLRDIQTQYWSLSSNAFQRQPNPERLPSCEEVIESLGNLEHSVIYLLKRNHRIISSMKVTQKKSEPGIVIFSHVETHPDFEKRGIFGLTLADTCLRTACESECKRIEITTWSFNRKGIPLYKRYGFRAIPGTNLLMENYLPAIVKHIDAQPYFARHDYIRTLQNQRSYGYDAVEVDGLSVFEYHWKPRKSDDTLRVLVDWKKKEIIDVECKIMESPSLIRECHV